MGRTRVVVLAVLLGLAACGTTGEVRSEPGAALSAAIDQPAVDRVAPPDAVVNVRTAFGAVGDGRSDDTAAIQAAISSGLGLGNPHKIIYFPDGTYLVSTSLQWRLPDGTWSTGLCLLGQNRDRTVIKLADATPGFGDPAAPRAMVVTGSQNADPDGSGNQAFHNFVFDLTIDAGAGNPGADGIDFLANNRGAIRNVVLRAAPGSGNSGISMTRKWPGPALLQDVRVIGFARGILLGRYEYSMTAEDIRLSDQREAGIENQNNVLTVRRLVSRNRVVAVRNGVAGVSGGLLTLLDSELLGGAPGAAGVDNNGTAFIRGLRASGYRSPIRDGEMIRNFPSGALEKGEWTSKLPLTLHGSAPASLQLPVAAEPPVPNVPASGWAAVASFGALPDDDADDTEAIQVAFDSGRPIVALRSGVYRISRPLRVPATVQAVEGFDATIEATGGEFAGASTAPVFSAIGRSEQPLFFSYLNFKAAPLAVDVERLGARPIVLRDIHFKGLPFRGSAGPLYLTDVEGGGGWRFSPGHQVWARQFNAEQSGTKIRNDGADLWILGLKTEQVSTVVESTAGARTEILGALFYPTAPVPPATPAFVSRDSALSATFDVSAVEPARNYAIFATATCGGVTEQLNRDSAGRGGVVLYSQRCPL